MNADEKKLFPNPSTSKRQIPLSGLLIVMVSFCLLGCHQPPSQRNQAAATGGAQTGRGLEADSPKPLPKVLLVGDSITGYYTPAVQRQLAGSAEVTRLFRSTSSNFLARLDEVIAAQPDLIHLNCGLWDMIILTNTGMPQVSL